MARYASGKGAYGYSDRSGFRYRLNEMLTEWNGLKVGPDEYESKHPQLEPSQAGADPQALHDPRPPVFNQPVSITFPTFNSETLEVTPVAFMKGSVGIPIVSGVAPGEATSVSITGVVGTSAVGSVTASNISSATVTLTGVAGTSAVGSVSFLSITVYTVTVASGTNSYGSGNKYYIAGLSGASPTLTLNEGSTYRFDQSDSSNSGHPLRFSTTANGSHGGGSEYTTGVSHSGTPGSSGAYVQITVAASAPTLYYYCTNHSGMGGTANTP